MARSLVGAEKRSASIMASVAQPARGGLTSYLSGRNRVSSAVINGVPYSTHAFNIGTGDASISRTIGHMQALVNGPEGVLNPQVRATALEAVRGSVKNVSEIDAVYKWVKSHIEFRGENDETLQSPLVTLQLKAGDCDDHSILAAALLQSVGYKVRFKTVATRPDTPDFTHVYAEVLDKRNRQWVSLDTTVARAFAGWEPPMYRSRIYPVRARRLRGVGDDASFQPISPLVPGVNAPSGLSPGWQAAFDLVQPFAQAGASYLAHGQTANPNFSSSFNFAGTSAGLPSSIPPWLWITGAGLIVFLAMKRR